MDLCGIFCDRTFVFRKAGKIVRIIPVLSGDQHQTEGIAFFKFSGIVNGTVACIIQIPVRSGSFCSDGGIGAPGNPDIYRTRIRYGHIDGDGIPVTLRFDAVGMKYIFRIRIDAFPERILQFKIIRILRTCKQCIRRKQHRQSMRIPITADCPRTADHFIISRMHRIGKNIPDAQQGFGRLRHVFGIFSGKPAVIQAEPFGKGQILHVFGGGVIRHSPVVKQQRITSGV